MAKNPDKRLANLRPGNKRGPNKFTKALKDAILEAAETSHPEGTVGYLRKQAADNPAAFMTLLGKVLPTQVEGTGKDGALVVTWLPPSD